MVFADLKDDFVFRRVFAAHPDVLRGLLDDLLEREGERAIESIEVLPGEEVPAPEGPKPSSLDVRCKDRSGTPFVVEVQLVRHPGFVNLVVYNACKAYVAQLGAGGFSGLMDVVTLAICDFEVWPDAEQDRQGLPRVPMLSRWSMMESSSQSRGLSQIQSACLELPKQPARRPGAPGPALWAWLFVHAPELSEVPPDLPQGPHRQALELARQATFTKEELQAYERARGERAKAARDVVS